MILKIIKKNRLLININSYICNVINIYTNKKNLEIMNNEMKIGKSYITKDGRKLELLNIRSFKINSFNSNEYLIYDFKNEDKIYLSFGDYQMNINFKK